MSSIIDSTQFVFVPYLATVFIQYLPLSTFVDEGRLDRAPGDVSGRCTLLCCSLTRTSLAKRGLYYSYMYLFWKTWSAWEVRGGWEIMTGC